MEHKRSFVYILTCGDGTLYTGWTTDPHRRVAAHSAGKGAKYTKVRLPVALAYLEECPCKGDALRREYAIKQLTRTEKLALIEAGPPPLQANPMEGEALDRLAGK